MGKYFESDAMNGEKPFFCYNCGKKLISNLIGTYKLDLKCPRCKSEIAVTCPEPIPEELAVKLGLLVEPLAKK